MRYRASQSLILSLSLIGNGLCLPGFQHHPSKKVVGNLNASPVNKEPLITAAPRNDKMFEARAVQIADDVTISCSGSDCVAYSYNLSPITTFPAALLTATNGTGCIGAGCVRASSILSAFATATGGSAGSANNSVSTTAPFGNGTDTAIAPNPTESSNVLPSNVTASAISTNASSTLLRGPTATGTGVSSNTSSTERAPFGNSTTPFTVGPPQPGPTAGTGVLPVGRSSETVSSNTTGSSTFSSRASSFGTGTGVISASPALTDDSRGPFANSTVTSTVQTETTGTGVSPEGTSTTLTTNRTTVSVTTYNNASWAPWSGTTAQAADTSTTSCTDETETPDQQTRADAADASFKSTATLSFADTTYTVPVPASYTSEVPSPNSNEAEASSFAEAVSAPPTSPASPTPGPTITAYPDTAKATSQPYYPDPSPHLQSTTFDAVSYKTSSCYTTTFFDVITSPKFSLKPTGSTGICYGIKCNAESSCIDWMSVVPLTDANGKPITTTSRKPPYANATATGMYPGQGTGVGTVTGGGFYPADTGAATSAFTENPWPSSPNATRNSAAYTNTVEVTASSSNSSARTVASAEATSTRSSATADTSATSESESTSSTEIPQSQNITRVQPVATDDAVALHPWQAWTATLETSTVTDDSTSADATATSDAHNDQNEDGSLARMMHNNLVLDSMHKRSAIKAGRKHHRKRAVAVEEKERQEKKYDRLLQKKRVEWEAKDTIKVREEQGSCCRGMSVYCWFVRSRIGGDC